MEGTRLGTGASQVVLLVKNPPANAGDARDTGSISGLGRSPGAGNGNSSILAWEIPRPEEPGRLQSMGAIKRQTRLSMHTDLALVGSFFRGSSSHIGGLGLDMGLSLDTFGNDLDILNWSLLEVVRGIEGSKYFWGWGAKAAVSCPPTAYSRRASFLTSGSLSPVFVPCHLSALASREQC